MNENKIGMTKLLHFVKTFIILNLLSPISDITLSITIWYFVEEYFFQKTKKKPKNGISQAGSNQMLVQ